MRKTATHINASLSRFFLLLVVVAVGTGLILPPEVAVLRAVLPLVLAGIVFTMGTSCTVDSFREIVREPGGFLTALVLIFLVMPVIGYGVGMFFYRHEPQLFLGHVLVGVVPVAVTSVVWTGIAGGNVALSIALVSFVTLVSGAVLPLQLSLLVGTTVDFNAFDLVVGLSKTIVFPATVGLLVRYRAPCFVETARPYMDLAGKLGMTVVLLTNGVLLRPIIADLGWDLPGILFTVAIQMAANFSIALGVATLVLGKKSRSRLAVMFSSSMRNNAAGLVIAANYFTPAATLPIIGCFVVQHFVAGIFGRIARHIETPSSQ